MTTARFALKVGLAFMLILFAACNPAAKYINSQDVLRWETHIQRFDSLNAVEYSDASTLLVTGSSSVRLWDSIHVDLAPYRVMQRGYGGARLSDFNYYVERIIKPQSFKAILVFVGNDISGGGHDRTPKEVFQLYKYMVKKIRTRNPHTPLFWIETTPTPKRWHVIGEVRKANALIREYCDRNEDLYFIGTSDKFTNASGLPDSAYFRNDMLHLNREGYLRWSDRIKASLAEAGVEP